MDRMLLCQAHVKSDAGFSLLEAVVAVTILAVGVCALAQLSVISTKSNQRAKTITTASVLAQQKIEQLRALVWGLDQFGARVTDTASDTSVVPAAPSGGTGLRSSPGNALTTNAPGYSDFLDTFGRPATLAGTAVYIRRWSIEPLPTDPDNTIVIQVRVIHRLPEHANESVQLLTVRSRRAT